MREDILTGALEPGSRLTIEFLKRRYKIGAGPIREALWRLSAEAFVKSSSHRGFEVMNVFRDEHDILHGNGKSPKDTWGSPDWAKKKLFVSQGYRQMYHKGFALDDADRYGPALDLVKELHRRVEDYELAANQETADSPAE